MLSVFPDPAFIPLVTAFMENSAQAQGLARKEALALTLAGEEVFTYLCRLVPAGQHLEIHSVKGGYYVRTDFIFTARELNLRAFNLDQHRFAGGRGRPRRAGTADCFPLGGSFQPDPGSRAGCQSKPNQGKSLSPGGKR